MHIFKASFSKKKNQQKFISKFSQDWLTGWLAVILIVNRLDSKQVKYEHKHV